MEMAILAQKTQLDLIQLNNMNLADNVTVSRDAVKLPTMHENEEALSYFQSFERTAILYCVEERRRARMLSFLIIDFRSMLALIIDNSSSLF